MLLFLARLRSTRHRCYHCQNPGSRPWKIHSLLSAARYCGIIGSHHHPRRCNIVSSSSQLHYHALSALLQLLAGNYVTNLRRHACRLVRQMYLSESQVQSDFVGLIVDSETLHLPDIHAFTSLCSIMALNSAGAVAPARLMAARRFVPVPSSNHGSVALTPTASISSRQTKELSRSTQGQY